jgi:pyrroline-5-carboxylate reductase
MPNIGAFYNCSFTAIAGDREAVQFGEELFREIGEVVVVNGDDEIDIATAITGSGPAYLAVIREAVEDCGVYLGLKREIASKLAEGLFKSFAGIEEKSCIIKEKVMSPNGTTAEGIFRLEREGIRGKIMEAIIDGYKKAKKI